MRATKALIHLENLKNNIHEIRKVLTPGTKICAAVKADAYGHGAVPCAKAAVEAGADFLSVATVNEGLELRNSGITSPVLLLSLCTPDELEAVVSNRLTPFVFDDEYISLLSEICRKKGIKKFPVHLAIDTGMGRIGCLPKDAGETALKIVDSDTLLLEGTATHFAMSDCISERGAGYTELQFKRFTDALNDIKSKGIDSGIRHCANSAATLKDPDKHLDMVRPGIILYGYYAGDVSKKYLDSIKKTVLLKPVMTLESQITSIRPFSADQYVGYGCTWKSNASTNIGVIPAGYGDGWLRKFSECGVQVASGGKNYPIRGRICMDQCMIDLGEKCTVKRWDKVILFGDESDGALQTADDIARLTGTISYEITCGISKRVPRIFIN